METSPLVIQGKQVELHRFCASDLTVNYIAWLNDPVNVRYSNQRFITHTLASCTRYMRTFEDSPNLFLSIRMKDSGTAIGTMTAYISPHHGTADMGILLGERSVRGQGLGLDAWGTLLRWLLAEGRIRKVTAGTLSCNAAMLSIIDRSGMTHEGTRYRQEIVEGVEHDILYFARFANV